MYRYLMSSIRPPKGVLVLFSGFLGGFFVTSFVSFSFSDGLFSWSDFSTFSEEAFFLVFCLLHLGLPGPSLWVVEAQPKKVNNLISFFLRLISYLFKEAVDSFKHVQFIIHGIHSHLKALQNLYFIFGSCLLSSYLICQESCHGSSNLKMVKLQVIRWSKSYEDKLSTWLLRCLRY